MPTSTIIWASSVEVAVLISWWFKKKMRGIFFPCFATKKWVYFFSKNKLIKHFVKSKVVQVKRVGLQDLRFRIEIANCFIACIFIRRLLYFRPVAAFSRKSSLFYLLCRRRAARQAALQQQQSVSICVEVRRSLLFITIFIDFSLSSFK